MKFTLLTTLMAVAASVSAAPAPEPAAYGSAPPKTTTGPKNPFQLMSLRSASPVHFGSFSASKSSLLLNLPKGKQAAKCDKNPEGVATFYIKDGGLYLYNKGNGKPQQLYVDRSGMGMSFLPSPFFLISVFLFLFYSVANCSIGQGKIGYISGDQSPPRNAELKGWKRTKSGEYDFLGFGDDGLIVCPGGPSGSWSVWLDIGVQKPGGNKGCLPISTMVLPVDKPVSCTYTSYE